MKIYYFSGTGNSFYVAKKIADHFSHVDIKSISEFRNRKEIKISGEEVVIICPIYFYGIPYIVENFIENLIFDNVKYFSFIFTAEYPNGLAISMLKKICIKKNIKLNSCFYLKMPTNYIIKSKMLTSDEIDKVLSKAEKKIAQIVDIIKMKRDNIEKDSKIYSLIVNAKKEYSKWKNSFPEFDSKFFSTENCNGCKLCEKHCPVNNITVSKKPVWNKRCEACLKCINICPMQTIQYDNKTEGRKRYINPKVKINEFQ